MRREHFERLAPVCPHCSSQRGEDHPLTIGRIETEGDDHIVEGVLLCSNADCLLEYPIIDGVPLLVTPIRAHVQGQLESIIARDDLSETIESMLGDATGPGSTFDTTRMQLGAYAWDHYGEFDPEASSETPRPGSAARVLKRGLDLIDATPAGPRLDVGAATGRGTFELANVTDDLVLGVDLNFSFLRLAQQVLRTGRVCFPRRRVGVVYDRRSFDVRFESAARVDFWMCDALAPPFPAGTFGGIVGLHVLDSVASPLALLQSLDRLSAPGASMLLACPYDWSNGTTPLEGWIGGHSQRGGDAGSAPARLRRLFDTAAHPQAIDGWEVTGEADDVPWTVRLHERAVTEYVVHLLALRKKS